jgi:luciferase family oxidoreductase group 1
MKYGILDFGSIGNGSNAISTIHETLELAQIADTMGFSRYWLSEHHESGVAWKSPEIVIALIAGYTKQIRVGAAGVLLALNSPLKIAQTYKLLDNLYEARIDLGLAKGSADAEKIKALLDGGDFSSNASQYYERVNKIISFMNDQGPENNIPPVEGSVPEIWILGTSSSSIDYLVSTQTNFSLSLFHQMQEMPSSDIIRELKEKFYKKHQKEPVFNIAISAICSANEKIIKEVTRQTNNIKVNFTGDRDAFLEYLEQLQNEYRAEEIIINNLGRTMEEKLMLMEAMGKKEKVLNNLLVSEEIS